MQTKGSRSVLAPPPPEKYLRTDQTRINWKITIKMQVLLLGAFSALTLLVGRQEGHPACRKLSGEVLAWLSVAVRCRLTYHPADATATH